MISIFSNGWIQKGKESAQGPNLLKLVFLRANQVKFQLEIENGSTLREVWLEDFPMRLFQNSSSKGSYGRYTLSLLFVLGRCCSWG